MEEITGRAAWFALLVRASREKAVAEILRRKDQEVFLPLYRTTRAWSDRRKEVTLPLLPGYVFCRLSVQQCLPILVTPGVFRIVGYGNIPALIHDSEIEALRTLVSSQLPCERWPFLTTGQKVRITTGPLADLEGICIQQKKQHRLVLSLSLLQRSVAVEVDLAWVEPVGSCSRLPAVPELLPMVPTVSVANTTVMN